jgi:hypothetical protein
MGKLPPGGREKLERHVVKARTELDRIDGLFRQRFARALSTEYTMTVRDFVIEKFDAAAEWFMPLSVSQKPADINPAYEEALKRVRNQTYRVISEVLKTVPRDECAGLMPRTKMWLEGRALVWLGRARTRHLARFPEPDVRMAGQVPLALRQKRRGIVREFCSRNELTAVGLESRTGISESALRGIVRGDRLRFAPETEARLLRVIGVSPAQWNELNRNE